MFNHIASRITEIGSCAEWITLGDVLSVTDAPGIVITPTKFTEDGTVTFSVMQEMAPGSWDILNLVTFAQWPGMTVLKAIATEAVPE